MITNVSIQSATDKDTSTTADVATYENEIEILVQLQELLEVEMGSVKVTMTLRMFQAI